VAPDLLPPVLKGFKAVPPLVTDIDLSMDDKFLYVACWGTGDYSLSVNGIYFHESAGVDGFPGV
jgi:56kDa selenium binding protein (SBP56)